jgi:hypothetical protein
MTNPYEPRIFDGPAEHMPDRIKAAAGLHPDDDLAMIDMNHVRMIVVVTDDNNAHVGGPASNEEKIDLLLQVLDGIADHIMPTARPQLADLLAVILGLTDQDGRPKGGAQ